MGRNAPIKALVWRGIGDITVEEVPDPRDPGAKDAIVRLAVSAICGTDPYFIRGTFSGMKPGAVLGNESVGMVKAVGPMMCSFGVGDRVVIPSTVACGTCSYCRADYPFAVRQREPQRQARGHHLLRRIRGRWRLDGPQAEFSIIPCGGLGRADQPARKRPATVAASSGIRAAAAAIEARWRSSPNSSYSMPTW